MVITSVWNSDLFILMCSRFKILGIMSRSVVVETKLEKPAVAGVRYEFLCSSHKQIRNGKLFFSLCISLKSSVGSFEIVKGILFLVQYPPFLPGVYWFPLFQHCILWQPKNLLSYSRSFSNTHKFISILHCRYFRHKIHF